MNEAKSVPSSQPTTYQPQIDFQQLDYSKIPYGPFDRKLSYVGFAEAQDLTHYWYIIPGLAAIPLLVSLFLPWFTIGFFLGEISIDGLGNFMGPTLMVRSLPPAVSEAASSQTDGKYLLVIAGWILALAFGGLLQKDKVYAPGLVLLGFLAVFLYGYNLIYTIGKVFKLNTGVYSSTYSAFGFETKTGIGLILGTIAAVIILISGFVTFFRFYSNKTNKV